jgi:O-antigen ligase
MAAAALYVFRNDTPARHPYAVLAAGAAAALAAWGLDQALDLHGMVYELLGRSETLTNRTEVWELVREFEANPWVGTGFMSFWTGDRLNEIWKLLGSSINQAHNGYLEQYLNLGYVGVAFIVLITVTALGKAARQLATDRSAGMLRVCLILVAYLYNYTEAAFYGMNNMWLLLLVACIEVPGRTAEARVRRSSGMHAGRRLAAASRAQRRAAR